MAIPGCLRHMTRSLEAEQVSLLAGRGGLSEGDSLGDSRMMTRHDGLLIDRGSAENRNLRFVTR